MLKTTVKTRFIVPLLAFVLAMAFAPTAFADDLTPGTMDDGGDTPSGQGFGPGAAIENATITFDAGQSLVYTGKPIEPTFKVQLPDAETGELKDLVEGTDYQVFYKENINVSTTETKACAYAWCQDEEHMYFKAQEFTITKAPISSTKIKIANKAYTGKKLTPPPSITYNGMTLKKGTDYTVTYRNNKNAGVAKAIIKGKGNYKGKVTKTFKIVKASLSDARISNVNAKTYTGKKIQPKVTLRYKGKKLQVNKDYTIKYRNNKNVGIASITIRGKGNLKGKQVLQFAITPASISKCSISYKDSWYWNGSLIKPAVTVKYKGKKLKAGKDYLVGYANNDVVGTAWISIQGKGNFTGYERKSFEIKLLPLTDASIAVDPQDGKEYSYTGEVIVPQVTVKILVNGTSYYISPNYYDVFYISGGTSYTRTQALTDSVFKGDSKTNKTFTIRIQAKEGSNFFTSYREVKYTILKKS